MTGAPLDVIPLFEEHGALLRGHFRLSSGLHSPEYWQCARVLSHPRAAEHLGRALAGACREWEPGIVIGPAMGGLIIAHEVARALDRPMLFTERQDGAMCLRRGFSIDPHERIVIVEDVVTTGGSVKEVIALVRGMGATVVGVGSIVNRMDGANPFDVAYRALAAVPPISYTAEECPLCRDGVPLTKPGSRPTPAA